MDATSSGSFSGVRDGDALGVSNKWFDQRSTQVLRTAMIDASEAHPEPDHINFKRELMRNENMGGPCLSKRKTSRQF